MDDALAELAELVATWDKRRACGTRPVTILRRAVVMACQEVAALELAKHAAFTAEVHQALKEADDPATVWVSQDEAKARSAARREKFKAAVDIPTPWYPPDTTGWVEVPDDCMERPAELGPDIYVQVLVKCERDERNFDPALMRADYLAWDWEPGATGRIVAYRKTGAGNAAQSSKTFATQQMDSMVGAEQYSTAGNAMRELTVMGRKTGGAA